MDQWEMEDQLNRFEDKREIKNLMGKYVHALATRRDGELWTLFWAQGRADVAFGVNDGFYSGPEAIQGFYRGREEKVRASSRILQGIFPRELGEMDEETVYGVGVFEQKPVQNAYIVVAGDRQTAKGLWALNGSFSDVTTAGPTVSWIWAYVAADFVWEDGAWKLWHMQYLEDIRVRCGQNWAQEERALPEREEFQALREITLPEPNVKRTLWTRYHGRRPFAGTPQIPEPYATFSETFSYGV